MLHNYWQCKNAYDTKPLQFANTLLMHVIWGDFNLEHINYNVCSLNFFHMGNLLFDACVLY